MHISGISGAYHGNSLGISQAYLRHQLQLGSWRRHTRWGRFPLGRRLPAVKKALFPEQNHSARRKSQTFILRFPGFSTPIPATTFSLLTSNERKEEALRRRRSSTLSPLYRGLGWEGKTTWRTSPSVLSQFFSKQCLLHDMHEICPRYAKIFPRYAPDMPKICPRYAQDMPEKCQRYAQDMPMI